MIQTGQPQKATTSVECDLTKQAGFCRLRRVLVLGVHQPAFVGYDNFIAFSRRPAGFSRLRRHTRHGGLRWQPSTTTRTGLRLGRRIHRARNLTRIVSAPKPRYQRRKKPAKAAPVESRLVTATKHSKRVRPSDGSDVEVPESVKAFVKRMMQPP